MASLGSGVARSTTRALPLVILEYLDNELLDELIIILCIKSLGSGVVWCTTRAHPLAVDYSNN